MRGTYLRVQEATYGYREATYIQGAGRHIPQGAGRRDTTMVQGGDTHHGTRRGTVPIHHPGIYQTILPWVHPAAPSTGSRVHPAAHGVLEDHLGSNP